nr:hypothetical protein HK105_003853 [Polyrhizophydium stewartii]
MRTLGPAAALTPHIDAINAAARAVSDLVSSDAATSNLARLSAELRRPGPCIAIDGDLIHDFKSALQQIVRSIESWTPNQEPAADVLNAQLAGSYARREAAMRQLTEAQKDLTQFIQLVEATVPQHAAVQRMAQFAQPTPRKRPSTFKDSPPKRAYMGSPIAPESSAYLSAESELL